MSDCSIEGCQRRAQARGWCDTHYTRWKRHGSPQAAMPVARGWGRRGAWTKAEDYFVLDNPDLTAEQAGAALGRTASAVTQRRRILKRSEAVQFDANWKRGPKDAWMVGSHTLICKTCPRCGLLLDAVWFRRNADTRYTQECRSCESLRRSGQVTTETRERQAELERIAADQATRWGEEYTGRDLEVLADPDLSLFQMALVTKRTIKGVAEARRKYLPDDNRRVRLGDPTESQWTIQFAEPIREAFSIGRQSRAS